MTGRRETERARRFAAEDGVVLSARFWGDAGAPVTLLLHGGGANGSWWSPLVQAVAALGVEQQFVALDFRGHGDSDYPQDTRVGAFHGDVESLLAHLDLEAREYGLVGHSLGAHVALDHAACHPPVRSVMAIEPSRGGSKGDRRRARLALAARRTHRTRQDALDRFRFLPGAPLADDALRLRIAERSIRREPDGRYGYSFDPRWFRLPAKPPEPKSRIACPVLVVRGGDSGLLTHEGAALLAREIPDGRVLEIPGTGHNVHLERPDRVAEALAAQLGAGARAAS
ncbi:MAG: alpha/beta fold hydrolase [Myxococcota bacterium]